jgi:hypothetical protein
LNEKKTFWTKEMLQDEANKYDFRDDFKKNSKAYSVAHQRGLLDELFKNHPNNGYSDSHLKKGYWTKERLQEEVAKYKTRGEFWEKNSPAANVALRNNLMDELFKNHPNEGHSENRVKNGTWTKKRLQEEANKYNNRKEFEKNSKGYKAALRKGLMDELFKNHPNDGYSEDRERKGYWTKERLQEEANKYETRGEFQKKDINGYSLAIEKGLMDELFKNHPNEGFSEDRERKGYWTKERLQEEADKCKNRDEFSNTKAYSIAYNKGLIDELFKNHPNEGYSKSKPINWTLEKLQKEANKYETRNDFKNGYHNAHRAASRLGLMDELFKNHPNFGYKPRKFKFLKNFK